MKKEPTYSPGNKVEKVWVMDGLWGAEPPPKEEMTRPPESVAHPALGKNAKRVASK
jgi:hypothetical protein